VLFATVSVAALLGIAAFTVLKSGRVGLGFGLLLWLSGFTAASTGIAPYVNHAIAAAVRAVAHIH
jgi:hypothetical protein